MRELALFAGAGGGLLGSQILGWRTVCAVEVDAYARSVLFERQKEGHLERFPIWDDIQTFDGRPWRGLVDVLSGGFPCNDISSAGAGGGVTEGYSVLWFQMLRVIEECRPPFVFAENSSKLRTRGLGTILKGLAGLGYDARWCVLGARHAGAPHQRDRMWLVAHANNEEHRDVSLHAKMALLPPPKGFLEQTRLGLEGSESWWSEPRCTRMDDGLADRMERISAIGKGQVPSVAALAWSVLTSDLISS